jgi:GrpB-like predicted nucleotidyltransferase (UPF0157 family)
MVNGLIGGPEKREIIICDYDPCWPQKFAEHARRIRGAVGPATLRIEHIGSTSVPGLAAKPIIDILLVVENSADERTYLPQLERAGYVLRVREPDFHEHRMFRTQNRDMHIHIFSRGSVEIERYLTFRDRLRTNVADRQLYETTKRKLAAQDWPDMNAYADAKTAVIEAITARARASNDKEARKPGMD